MYFRGVISSLTTLPNFFADIVGIVTGSITSAGGLTTAWDAGSEFINTTAPGWTNYDAAAGSAANSVTPCVVRAAESDNASSYKNIYIYSVSSTELGFKASETWNSGTHTGTNQSPAVTATNWGCMKMTAGYVVIISASPTHIFIAIQSSLTTLGANGCCVFLSEYTRDDPWNTVANGYPSWVFNGSGTATRASGTAADGGHLPRLFNTATGSDSTSVAQTSSWGTIVPNFMFCPGAGLGAAAITSMYAGATGSCCLGWAAGNGFALTSSWYLGANSSKAAAKYLVDVVIRQVTNTYYTGLFLGGNITTKTPFIYFGPLASLAAGDTMTISATDYIVVNLWYGRTIIKKA